VAAPARLADGEPVSSRTATPAISASIEEADHHLQRDPPQPAGTFGEVADDVDGAGCVKLTHHRQREIRIVAITSRVKQAKRCEKSRSR